MTGQGKSDEARRRVDEAIAAQGRNDTALAARLYREAMALDPDYPAPHFNLGLMRLAVGDLVGAENELRAALRLHPEFPEAWVAIAEVLEATGREAEALAALDTAIAQRKGFAGALFNASVLLRKLGRVTESEARLAAFGDAQADTAIALQAAGRRSEAAEILLNSLSMAPAHARLRRTLAPALDGATLNNAGEKERSLVASLCMDEDISTTFLTTTVCGLLKSDAPFAVLLQAAREGADPFAAAEREAQAFMRSPLLLAALPRTTFMDMEVEDVLTSLRRAMLARTARGTEPLAPMEFICALARQCFYSDYAFFETGEERTQLEDLLVGIRRGFGGQITRVLETQLAIACLYDPLSSIARRVDFIDSSSAEWSEPFRPVVQDQLLNRWREKEIEPGIPSLTPIIDATSLAVRAQYEESPYPVWVSLHRPEVDSFEALSDRLRPGRIARTPPGPIRILVAGCGTGHHPLLVARSLPGSEVLAVDLSRASLAYASCMAGHLGVTNVRFAQADLLRLGALTERFSIVESAGVLHHLDDPMRGWKVLVGLMEADGLMRIALYSETARAGVRAARGFLQPLGLESTPDGVRRSRRAIADLPAGHPARDVLTFGDFFTLNGCRDLLMHVKEHVFTLPRIAECLEELGLAFLRMECQPQVTQQFRALFPAAGADADLEAWHRFECACPEAFKSMYQFWCARKE